MLETLPTEKMALFLRILAFVVFLQAFSVRSFLLNTNTSHPLHSSGQTSGSDANAFIYLLQKVDNLQLQIHQQSKTMEEQNKTLDAQNKRIEAQTKLMEAQNKTMEAQSKTQEAQTKILETQNKTIEAQSKTLEAQNKRIEAQTKLMEAQNKAMEELNKTLETQRKKVEEWNNTMEAQSKIMKEQNKTLEAQKSLNQELLNFTRQTPSTVSLSNDLSILDMHVRRLMDEYQRLYNISNTNDLAINKMANSVRVLTLHLTTQDNKVNQMDHDLNQHVNTLNGSLFSVFNRVSQNERDTSSNFSLISSSLSRLNTDMAVMKTHIGFTAGVTSYDRYWSGDILVFPHVVTNTGNGYNPSTGKFTAPRTGTYVFFVTGVSYSTQYLSLAIVHNGAYKVRTYSSGYTSYQTGTNLAVLELRQGDTVWVRLHSGTGYSTDSVPITTFSGFLL